MQCLAMAVLAHLPVTAFSHNIALGLNLSGKHCPDTVSALDMLSCVLRIRDGQRGVL